MERAMAKKSSKTYNEKLKELEITKKILQNQKKQETQKFYSLIGHALLKEINDDATKKNELSNIINKHITKSSDLELIKENLLTEFSIDIDIKSSSITESSSIENGMIAVISGRENDFKTQNT
jgi:hypothetical protein